MAVKSDSRKLKKALRKGLKKMDSDIQKEKDGVNGIIVVTRDPWVEGMEQAMTDGTVDAQSEYLQEQAASEK